MRHCVLWEAMASAEGDLHYDLHVGAQHWAVALAAAWLTSPLACFFAFVLMRCCMKSSANPVILKPSKPAPAAATTMRVISLNMCLLPGGLSFSGSWLFDGNDKKEQRLAMLLEKLDECDVLLLNELWGCWWSSYHTSFFRRAVERGFYVCVSPMGLLLDSGNVIVSRYPLMDASTWAFRSASGWQAIVPNGVLHAVCVPTSGAKVHLFTTHLQCTSAPTEDMQTVAPAGKVDHCDEGCLSGMVRAIGRADVDHEAEKRLQQLHELSRFVHAKVGTQGHFVLGGDFNMIGGSADYLEAAKLFGRQSANAPTFAPTYTTRSFLTPPGWKNIAWESNLDHMFTNLDVCDFQVKSTVDISDHLPMHLTVSQPRTSDDIITHELIEDMDHRDNSRLLGSWSASRSCAGAKLLYQGARSKISRRLPQQIVQPTKQFDRHHVTVPLMLEDVPLSP